MHSQSCWLPAEVSVEFHPCELYRNVHQIYSMLTNLTETELNGGEAGDGSTHLMSWQLWECSYDSV